MEYSAPEKVAQKYIRNFSIIAHVDHGKSTLADRLLEVCKAIDARERKDQILDSMDIERERGITIKAQTVRLMYQSRQGQWYQFNLMDTPGHVDFAYEVSRSLAACEGSLLVIDASQGIEAQTLANVYQAIVNDHEIIPVLNKIDLPAADPERVKDQIQGLIGLDASQALLVSAKTGQGIEDLCEAIVEKLPPPEGDEEAPLQALLVDSWFDPYLGVIILVRIKQGILRPGMSIRMMAANASYDVDQVGVFTPKKVPVPFLGPGEVGYIIANIKHTQDCQVGDTITETRRPTAQPLPGFKPSTPVVFCCLFPTDPQMFGRLRESLDKLRLNDASFSYEPTNSAALGAGFRCGFLGLLHLEIIQERLEREFDLDLITTAPTVAYQLLLRSGEEITLHNPADWPDASHIQAIYEPWIRATILVPDTYLGEMIALCEERRGHQVDLSYHSGQQVKLVYRLPLNEIVFDFYDHLKSRSRGYASFDYEQDTYEESDLVKITILVNGEVVDALAFVVHRSHSESYGRRVCEKLKDHIPRQLFKIPIQAAIGGKIIARETVSALRKDVTAKCYGGDISRKRKLLEKQKEGKKRMRMYGNVEIPQAAFLAVLRGK